MAAVKMRKTRPKLFEQQGAAAKELSERRTAATATARTSGHEQQQQQLYLVPPSSLGERASECVWVALSAFAATSLPAITYSPPSPFMALVCLLCFLALRKLRKLCAFYYATLHAVTPPIPAYFPSPIFIHHLFLSFLYFFPTFFGGCLSARRKCLRHFY